MGSDQIKGRPSTVDLLDRMMTMTKNMATVGDNVNISKRVREGGEMSQTANKNGPRKCFDHFRLVAKRAGGYWCSMRCQPTNVLILQKQRECLTSPMRSWRRHSTKGKAFRV
jgi:hypothetical protein